VSVNVQLGARLRRRATRRTTTPLSLVWVILAIIASTVICLLLVDSPNVGLASGVTIGLLLIPILMHRYANTPVAPVYLTVAFLFVAYPAKLLAFRLQIPGITEEFQGRLLDDQGVVSAMWMLSAGIVAYYLGYYRTPSLFTRYIKKARLPIYTSMSPRWYWLPLIACLIGWASFSFQMVASTWSSFAGLGASWDPKYNQALSYIFNYVWYGVIASAIWLSYQNLKRSWIGILISVSIIVATLGAVLLLMGSKTWLLSPILYLVAAMYMNDRRPPVWLIVPATVVVALFAFTFVPVYRSNYLETNSGRVGTVSELYQTGNKTLSELDETSVDAQDASANIFNRFSGIDNAVRVMEVVPEPLGYFYFSDLFSLPFSFVPRLVFPWKLDPQTPTAYTFEVAGMLNGGSAAPFPVAEGYINAGWIGVVILFWLWGVYQSILFNGFYLPRRRDALIQILYIFLMVQSVSFGNWITGQILGTPGQLITMIPLILIFGGMNRKIGDSLVPTRK